MPTKSWILTDDDRGIDIPDFAIAADDVKGTPHGWSVKKRTLHGGRREGVQVVEIDNGGLRLTVIPTRGMSVWRAWMEDDTLGWQSPVRGPVHPRFVPVSESSGLGWLDGFDELLVRCGLESNGAPDFDENHIVKYPLHGRIANLPAHFVEVRIDSDAGEISVSGHVDETRFHFQKLRLTASVTTRFHEPGFRVHDEVRNLSSSPAELQMLYHPNFGVPLLDAGSKLVVPAKSVVPRNAHAAAGIETWDSYLAEQPGFEEQVYFFELYGDGDGNTQTLLKNAHGTSGVSLIFNTKQLPCFTQWKNTNAVTDGYVTGIEPGTNFPNPRTFEAEQGRVVTLAGGATQAFDLGLAWHRAAKEVSAAETEIQKIQQGRPTKVYKEPQPEWCAGYTSGGRK